ncbi:hypothetical protein CN934_30475 [Ensifer sp. MMN_5]|nr:hypothetical protein CN934_30475 [Ensifer sp. MMN_5]
MQSGCEHSGDFAAVARQRGELGGADCERMATLTAQSTLLGCVMLPLWPMALLWADIRPMENTACCLYRRFAGRAD